MAARENRNMPTPSRINPTDCRVFDAVWTDALRERKILSVNIMSNIQGIDII